MIRVIISKRTFSGMKSEIFHWMYTLLRRRVLGRGEERIAVLDCLCPPLCPSLAASTTPWPLLDKASAASKWLPCHLLFPRRPTLPAPVDASASASRSRHWERGRRRWGGLVGGARASLAPEPCLGLAGLVVLELCIVSLLQSCTDCRRCP